MVIALLITTSLPTICWLIMMGRNLQSQSLYKIDLWHVSIDGDEDDANWFFSIYKIFQKSENTLFSKPEQNRLHHKPWLLRVVG